MALDFPDPSLQQTYVATNGITYVWNGTSWVVNPVLSVSKGGTGFTSFLRGDILFGNSSGTLSKLNAGSSGFVLSTNGTGADPTWIQVAVGQTVSTGSIYEIASYYAGTGASLKGSSTFTNDTSAGKVSITHTTLSNSSSTGALVVTGGLGIGGTINVAGHVRVGSDTYSKAGYSIGDILLDSGSKDTPGLLMYWASNKNFGLDTFGSTGATRVRFTKELNESGGAEVFSVDINGVTYINSGYGIPAPTFGVRAWVNFDGGGTIGQNQTIRGSGNVASVYKNSTGDYTITFASAMPDANYCIQGLARTPGAADSDVALNIKYNTIPAAGSFQITTARYGSALLDCAHIHVSVIR